MKITSNLRVLDSSWSANKLSFPTDRVLIKAMPDNADRIWLDIDGAAKADHCYPLDAGESVTLHVRNLNQLDFLFVVSTDKIVVIHESGPVEVSLKERG